MASKKREYRWIADDDDLEEAEEVGRKRQKKKEVPKIDLSMHEAALSVLPPHVRAVYTYAYQEGNYSPDRLQPDSQHCAFLQHLLSKQTKLIFLTGIPGSGKSTIINLAMAYLIHTVVQTISAQSIANLQAGIDKADKKPLKSIEAAKKMIVAIAPTGTAAASITGAITFDALFSGCDLEKGRFEHYNDVKKEIRDRIDPIKVLIMDEISMIHPIKFANGDKIFRLVKKVPGDLYGGIKLVISGDFFQLKPVFGQRDDITRAMQLLSKNAVAKNQHPLVFDTPSWIQHESQLRYVQLDRSFRQDPNQLEFMDLLSSVRDDTLREHHHKLLESRVMTYDAFCETTEAEVTPVFKRRDDVYKFNIERLHNLPGTEFAYMTVLICSSQPFGEVSRLLGAADPPKDYLANVLGDDAETDATEKDYSYGRTLDRHFSCKPNPISFYNTHATLVPGLDADGNSGFYFEKSLMAVTSVLKMAQEQDGHLGRANFLTRLKVGARISLTKNLLTKDGLVTGAKGLVVHFMSIASFLSASGTKRSNGAYVARKQDPRKSCTIVDEPVSDYTFRKTWGLVDASNGKSTNEARELFPLIQMDAPCKTRFILLTPLLSQLDVSSEQRQKQDDQKMKRYMSKSLANNRDQGTSSSVMSTLNPSQHFSLITQAKRNIKVDEGTNRAQAKIYALHMPVALAWGTTIHSIQGLTARAIWLGECNMMDDGMFYVVLSRVSRLDCIAWAKNPAQQIKANDRVKAFYARMIAMEAMRPN